MLKSFVTLTLASGVLLAGNSYGEWIGGTKGWKPVGDTLSTTARVGIGTSGPTGKLDVVGGDGSYSGPTLRLQPNSATYAWSAIELYGGTFDTINDYMIGRGCPTYYSGRALTFHIPSRSSFYEGTGEYPKIAFASSGSSTLGWIESETGNWYMSGKVGIGTTTPQEELHIVPRNSWNVIRMDGGSGGAAIDFFNSAGTKKGWLSYRNDSYFSIGNGTTDRLVVEDGGDVGIGTTSPDAKLHVAGNLKVDGTYHDGAVITGYIQPSNWSYSSSATSWTQLWSGTVNVPKNSVVIISIMGHWKITTTGEWAYLGAMIDGTSIHPAGSSCWGATHTYYTNWHPIGYTASADLSAGSHTLGAGVVVSSGGAVDVNGARLYYTIIPK